MEVGLPVREDLSAMKIAALEAANGGTKLRTVFAAVPPHKDQHVSLVNIPSPPNMYL
jgi:hypothetical protein